MKIEDYLSSILPTVSKMTVKEDLRNLQVELDSKSIPVFVGAADFFTKDYKWKSKDIELLQKYADKRVDHRAKNIVLLAKAALEQSSKNVGTVINLVDKYYAEEVMKDGMTYLKANLQQYIESMSFMSFYARRLLLVIYGLEAMGSKGPIDKALSRDLRWVNKHFSSFIICAKANLKSGKKIEKEFEAIPDMRVDPEAVGVVREQAGADVVDPNGFGFISVRMNPIYHARRLLVKWEVHRLRSAEEEKELLELKLAHLINERNGKKDAALEEAIETYEARVAKLDYQIKDYLNE